MLLAAISMTGLLASCGSVEFVPPITPGTGTSSTLTLTSINSFETNWKLAQDSTDQYGKPYAAGTSVICDDLDTTMSVNLSWRGYLNDLYVQFRGLTTDQYKNIAPFDANSSSGSGTATYTMAPATAPLSLPGEISAQAIIVNGKINVKGNTYVRLQGTDENGYVSNILESVTAIPVVDCVQ